MNCAVLSPRIDETFVDAVGELFIENGGTQNRGLRLVQNEALCFGQTEIWKDTWQGL